MGMDLTNERGTYVRFPPEWWDLALVLATSNGWHPQLKLLSKYGSNDGRWVSAGDAESLANACAHALKDPDIQKRVADILVRMREEAERLFPHCKPQPMKAFDFVAFTGRLRELIALCREGGFEIG